MSSRKLILQELELAPAVLVRYLLAVALILLACHAGLTVYHYEIEELPWLLRQIFDVDEEDTLPTWFSSALLLLTSVLLLLAARRHSRGGDRHAVYWAILAAGFLLMSIDEVAGIHETLNTVLEPHWTSWAVVLVLLIGISFIPFLRALPRATAIRFVLAGIVFISGAIGVELIGQPIDADTLAYNLLTLLEEGMEMIGVIVFLDALTDFLAQDRGR